MFPPTQGERATERESRRGVVRRARSHCGGLAGGGQNKEIPAAPLQRRAGSKAERAVAPLSLFFCV